MVLLVGGAIGCSATDGAGCHSGRTRGGGGLGGNAEEELGCSLNAIN